MNLTSSNIFDTNQQPQSNISNISNNYNNNNNSNTINNNNNSINNTNNNKNNENNYNESDLYLYQFAMEMYQNGISKFPFSTILRMNYSFFLMERMNNNKKALIELKNCEKYNPSFEEEFIIFRYCENNKIEENNNDEDDDDVLDIVSNIAYKNHFNVFKENLSEITYIYSEFWSLLLNSNQKNEEDLNKMNEYGEKINKLIEDIESHYKEMEKLKYNDEEVLSLYSDFYNDILNDKNKYEYYKNRLRDCQGNNDIDNNNNNNNNYNYNYNINYNNNNIFEEISKNDEFEYIFLGSENTNLGKIIKCSLNVCELFGYTPSELIGKNIEFIMPDMCHKYHNQVLINKLNKFKTQITQNYRNGIKNSNKSTYKDIFVFGKNKLKNAIPLNMKVFLMYTQDQSDLYFVSKINNDEIYNNENEKNNNEIIGIPSIINFYMKICFVLTDINFIVQYYTTNSNNFLGFKSNTSGNIDITKSINDINIEEKYEGKSKNEIIIKKYYEPKIIIWKTLITEDDEQNDYLNKIGMKGLMNYSSNININNVNINNNNKKDKNKNKNKNINNNNNKSSFRNNFKLKRQRFKEDYFLLSVKEINILNNCVGYVFKFEVIEMDDNDIVDDKNIIPKNEIRRGSTNMIEYDYNPDYIPEVKKKFDLDTHLLGFKQSNFYNNNNNNINYSFNKVNIIKENESESEEKFSKFSISNKNDNNFINIRNINSYANNSNFNNSNINNSINVSNNKMEISNNENSNNMIITNINNDIDKNENSYNNSNNNSNINNINSNINSNINKNEISNNNSNVINTNNNNKTEKNWHKKLKEFAEEKINKFKKQFLEIEEEEEENEEEDEDSFEDSSIEESSYSSSINKKSENKLLDNNNNNISLASNNKLLNENENNNNNIEILNKNYNKKKTLQKLKTKNSSVYSENNNNNYENQYYHVKSLNDIKFLIYDFKYNKLIDIKKLKRESQVEYKKKEKLPIMLKKQKKEEIKEYIEDEEIDSVQSKKIEYALRKEEFQPEIIKLKYLSIIIYLTYMILMIVLLIILYKNDKKVKEYLKIIEENHLLNCNMIYGLNLIRELTLLNNEKYTAYTYNKNYMYNNITKRLKQIFEESYIYIQDILTTNIIFNENRKNYLIIGNTTINTIDENFNVFSINLNIYTSIIQLFNSLFRITNLKLEEIIPANFNVYYYTANFRTNLFMLMENNLQNFILQFYYECNKFKNKIIIFIIIFLILSIFSIISFKIIYDKITKRKSSYLEVFFEIDNSVCQRALDKCEFFAKQLNPNNFGDNVSKNDDENSSNKKITRIKFKKNKRKNKKEKKETFINLNYFFFLLGIFGFIFIFISSIFYIFDYGINNIKICVGSFNITSSFIKNYLILHEDIREYFFDNNGYTGNVKYIIFI